MSFPGTKILFQIHNRRGLGHLMRGLNIAREISNLSPLSEIMFYAKCAPPEGLIDENFTFQVEPDPEGFSNWPEMLRRVAPHAVVYDTILPKNPGAEPLLEAAKYVYVMRKSNKIKQREIFENPFLKHVGLIVIPHTPAEFGWDIPPSLKEKVCFTGPIVRTLNGHTQKKLRDKFQVTGNEFLLTSTVGSGGVGPANTLKLRSVPC